MDTPSFVYVRVKYCSNLNSHTDTLVGSLDSNSKFYCSIFIKATGCSGYSFLSVNYVYFYLFFSDLLCNLVYFLIATHLITLLSCIYFWTLLQSVGPFEVFNRGPTLKFTLVWKDVLETERGVERTSTRNHMNNHCINNSIARDGKGEISRPVCRHLIKFCNLFLTVCKVFI